MNIQILSLIASGTVIIKQLLKPLMPCQCILTSEQLFLLEMVSMKKNYASNSITSPFAAKVETAPSSATTSCGKIGTKIKITLVRQWLISSVMILYLITLPLKIRSLKSVPMPLPFTAIVPAPSSLTVIWSKPLG